MRINKFSSQNEDLIKMPNGNMRKLLHNAVFANISYD